MVRETRYLFVGNLPEKVTEDEVSEHFKRYGKIQSVRFHEKKEDEDCVSATVAFGDIKSASKAHNSENNIDGKVLVTEYSEGSATGSAVTRTRQEPLPRQPAFTPHPRPAPYTNRPKGTEEGETYDNRDYYGSGGGTAREPAQFENRFPPPFNENGQNQARGRPRERFFRGGFKGNHGQRQFGHRHMEGHRSFDQSPMDSRDGTFERPAKTQPSPTHSTSRSSRNSSTRKQRSPGSQSRSRSNSSSSSSYSRSSSGSSDSGSDSHSSGSSAHSSPRHQLPSTATIPPQRAESQDSSASDTERDPLDKRPHGICITALPLRSSDTSLRDGLFHEYKKYGKVNAVQVAGANDDRYAIVSFKKAEDAEKAYEASLEKTFFGARIKVQTHEGIADTEDNEFRPPEAELDEYHPKATRTLFVGNLEKDITTQELRDRFGEYGEIIDIDVKRQGAVSAYAFVQYADITSVVKALKELEGQIIGSMKIKLGFGKSMPTNCIWLDNLADTVSESFLCRQFSRYGNVSHGIIDKTAGKALVFFSNIDAAQFALNEMRNRILNGKKIMTDFASRDCQNRFFEKMEKSGQLQPGQRPDERRGWVNNRPQGADGGQWSDGATGTVAVAARSRGNFRPFGSNRRMRGFHRGGTAFRGRGQTFNKENFTEEGFRRQRSYEDYSQGSGGPGSTGTPYSEGGEDSFEQDLRAYSHSQRERREAGESPTQYTDEMYPENYRRGSKDSRYGERGYKDRYSVDYHSESPGSDRASGYHDELRYEFGGKGHSEDKYFNQERYIPGREKDQSPSGNYGHSYSPEGRSWSRSPSYGRQHKDNFGKHTPPTPLGDELDDSQDPSPMDAEGSQHHPLDYKSKSGKMDDFDISEADIQEIRSTYPNRQEPVVIRSEGRLVKKRSYDDTFHSQYDMKFERRSGRTNAEFRRDLFQKVQEISEKMSGRHKESSGNHNDSSPSSSASTESEHGSLTEGELTKLQHEKLLLLEKLQQLEKEGSTSDNESADIEDTRKVVTKRPRLDPWQAKSGGQRPGSVIMPARKNLHQSDYQDPYKVDATQSYRKQMEAFRKIEEQNVMEDGHGLKDSGKSVISCYDSEGEDSAMLLSPREIPSGFVVKKRKKLDGPDDMGLKGQRSYRTKRGEEDDHASSDNDEAGQSFTRTDSIVSLRRLSSGHSSPRTPVVSQSLDHYRYSESDLSASECMGTNSSRKKASTKKLSESDGPLLQPRGHKDDHQQPIIIPLGDELLPNLDLKDPRHQRPHEEELMSLPLPRFAGYTRPLMIQPVHLGSPKYVDLKNDSPCFSPPSSGSKTHSPQMSPSDSNSGESQGLPKIDVNNYIPPEEEVSPSAAVSAPVSENEQEKSKKDGDKVLESEEFHEEGATEPCLEDLSIDERIRRLDEKMSRPTPNPPNKLPEQLTSISIPSLSAVNTPVANVDMYSKYKRRKKQDSIGSSSGDSKSEPSEIVRTLLSRSSIFDQDTRRLEQINEKYCPKSFLVNMDENPKSGMIRTKAAAKEMPLSTLPQSLAGRLGSAGAASFPTLSVNTNMANQQTSHLPFMSPSPNSSPRSPLAAPGSVLSGEVPSPSTTNPYDGTQTPPPTDDRDLCPSEMDNFDDMFQEQSSVCPSDSPNFVSTNFAQSQLLSQEPHNEESSISLLKCSDSSALQRPPTSISLSLTNDLVEDNSKSLLLNTVCSTQPSSSEDVLPASDIIGKSSDILFHESDIKPCLAVKEECKDKNVGESQTEPLTDTSDTASVLYKDVKQTTHGILPEDAAPETVVNESKPELAGLGKRKATKEEQATDEAKVLDNITSETVLQEAKMEDTSPDLKKARISTDDSKSPVKIKTEPLTDKKEKDKKDKNKENKKKEATEEEINPIIHKDKSEKKDKDKDGSRDKDKTGGSGKSSKSTSSKVKDDKLKESNAPPSAKKEKNAETSSHKHKSSKNDKSKEKQTKDGHSKKSKDHSSTKPSKEEKTPDKVDSTPKSSENDSNHHDKEKSKSGHKDTNSSHSNKDNQMEKQSSHSAKKKDGQTGHSSKSSKDSANTIKSKEGGEPEVTTPKDSKPNLDKPTNTDSPKTKPKTGDALSKHKASTETKHKDKTSGESHKHKDKGEVSKHKDKTASTDTSKQKSVTDGTKHKEKPAGDTKHKDKTALSEAKHKSGDSSKHKVKTNKGLESNPSKEKSKDTDHTKVKDQSVAKETEPSKPKDSTASGEGEQTKHKDRSKTSSHVKTKKGDTNPKPSVSNDKSCKDKSSDKDKGHKDKNSSGQAKSESKGSTHQDSKLEKSSEHHSSNKGKTTESNDKNKETKKQESDNKGDKGNDGKSSEQQEDKGKVTDNDKANKGTDKQRSDKKSSLKHSDRKSENEDLGSENKRDGKKDKSHKLSVGKKIKDKNCAVKPDTENSKPPSKNDSDKSKKNKTPKSAEKLDKSGCKSDKSDKSDKSAEKKNAFEEVDDFDWAEWAGPYVSMYDKVKRRSNTKVKEKEMDDMKKKMDNFKQQRKKKSKYSGNDDTDDCFFTSDDEDEHVVSKKKKSTKESRGKKKNAIFDSSMSSSDNEEDDPQFFLKSFQKSSQKMKVKGFQQGKKASILDIYSSDSEEDEQFSDHVFRERMVSSSKKDKDNITKKEISTESSEDISIKKVKNNKAARTEKQPASAKKVTTKRKSVLSFTSDDRDDDRDEESDMNLDNKLKPKKPQGKLNNKKDEKKLLKRKIFSFSSTSGSDMDEDFTPLTLSKNVNKKGPKEKNQINRKHKEVKKVPLRLLQTESDEDNTEDVKPHSTETDQTVGDIDDVSFNKKEKSTKESGKKENILVSEGKLEIGKQTEKKEESVGLFEKFKTFISAPPEIMEKNVKHGVDHNKNDNKSLDLSDLPKSQSGSVGKVKGHKKEGKKKKKDKDKNLSSKKGKENTSNVNLEKTISTDNIDLARDDFSKKDNSDTSTDQAIHFSETEIAAECSVSDSFDFSVGAEDSVTTSSSHYPHREQGLFADWHSSMDNILTGTETIIGEPGKSKKGKKKKKEKKEGSESKKSKKEKKEKGGKDEGSHKKDKKKVNNIFGSFGKNMEDLSYEPIQPLASEGEAAIVENNLDAHSEKTKHETQQATSSVQNMFQDSNSHKESIFGSTPYHEPPLFDAYLRQEAALAEKKAQEKVPKDVHSQATMKGKATIGKPSNEKSGGLDKSSIFNSPEHVSLSDLHTTVNKTMPSPSETSDKISQDASKTQLSEEMCGPKQDSAPHKSGLGQKENKESHTLAADIFEFTEDDDDSDILSAGHLRKSRFEGGERRISNSLSLSCSDTEVLPAKEVLKAKDDKHKDTDIGKLKDTSFDKDTDFGFKELESSVNKQKDTDKSKQKGTGFTLGIIGKDEKKTKKNKAKDNKGRPNLDGLDKEDSKKLSEKKTPHSFMNNIIVDDEVLTFDEPLFPINTLRVMDRSMKSPDMSTDSLDKLALLSPTSNNELSKSAKKKQKRKKKGSGNSVVENLEQKFAQIKSPEISPLLKSPEISPLLKSPEISPLLKSPEHVPLSKPSAISPPGIVTPPMKHRVSSELTRKTSIQEPATTKDNLKPDTKDMAAPDVLETLEAVSSLEHLSTIDEPPLIINVPPDPESAKSLSEEDPVEPLPDQAEDETAQAIMSILPLDEKTGEFVQPSQMISHLEPEAVLAVEALEPEPHPSEPVVQCSAEHQQPEPVVTQQAREMDVLDPQPKEVLVPQPHDFTHVAPLPENSGPLVIDSSPLIIDTSVGEPSGKKTKGSRARKNKGTKANAKATNIMSPVPPVQEQNKETIGQATNQALRNKLHALSQDRTETIPEIPLSHPNTLRELPTTTSAYNLSRSLQQTPTQQPVETSPSKSPRGGEKRVTRRQLKQQAQQNTDSADSQPNTPQVTSEISAPSHHETVIMGQTTPQINFSEDTNDPATMGFSDNSLDLDRMDDYDPNRLVMDDQNYPNEPKRVPRRGRKPKNYKEMNSGVLTRTNSPRSRTSPRSPRNVTSPKQSASPKLQSSPADIPSPVVKIERLPPGCKNVKKDGEGANSDVTKDSSKRFGKAVLSQISDASESDAKELETAASSSTEQITSDTTKEAANVFDFDASESEPKIEPVRRRPSRRKQRAESSCTDQEDKLHREHSADSKVEVHRPEEARVRSLSTESGIKMIINTGATATSRANKEARSSRHKQESEAHVTKPSKKSLEPDNVVKHPRYQILENHDVLANKGVVTSSGNQAISKPPLVTTIITNKILAEEAPAMAPKSSAPEPITTITTHKGRKLDKVEITLPTTNSPITPATPSTPMSNIDRIIDNVSKGIFEFDVDEPSTCMAAPHAGEMLHGKKRIQTGRSHGSEPVPATDHQGRPLTTVNAGHMEGFQQGSVGEPSLTMMYARPQHSKEGPAGFPPTVTSPPNAIVASSMKPSHSQNVGHLSEPNAGKTKSADVMTHGVPQMSIRPPGMHTHHIALSPTPHRQGEHLDKGDVTTHPMHVPPYHLMSSHQGMVPMSQSTMAMVGKSTPQTTSKGAPHAAMAAMAHAGMMTGQVQDVMAQINRMQQHNADQSSNKQKTPHTQPPTAADQPTSDKSVDRQAVASTPNSTSASAPTCVVHPITTTAFTSKHDALMAPAGIISSASMVSSIVTTTVKDPVKDKMHMMHMLHSQGPAHIETTVQDVAGRRPEGKQQETSVLKSTSRGASHHIPVSAHPSRETVPQRPPSAHSQIQKSSGEPLPPRPSSAHEQLGPHPGTIHEQLRAHLMPVGVKNTYTHGQIPPQMVPYFTHMLQKGEFDKNGGGAIDLQKMMSPLGQRGVIAASAATTQVPSPHPQLAKSPAIAQTAPSPLQINQRPSSPLLHKKAVEKSGQVSSKWMEDSRMRGTHPQDVIPSSQREAWMYGVQGLTHQRPEQGINLSTSQQPSPRETAHSQQEHQQHRLQQELTRRQQAEMQFHQQLQQQQEKEKEQERQKQDWKKQQHHQQQQEMMRHLREVSGPTPGSSEPRQNVLASDTRQTALVHPRSTGPVPSSHTTEEKNAAIDSILAQHGSMSYPSPDLRRTASQNISAFTPPVSGAEITQGIPASHLYNHELQRMGMIRVPLMDPGIMYSAHNNPAFLSGHLAQHYLHSGIQPDGRPHMVPLHSPSRPGQSLTQQGKHNAQDAVQAGRQLTDNAAGEGSLLSLLQRYPVMWQGVLALKNDNCVVQMHLIAGFQQLVKLSLPQQAPDGTVQPLRIAQRMRLEPTQLEGVIKRMNMDEDYCMLLALPCGRDHSDIIQQTRAMSMGFIQYLQQKQAAGIVNVADQGSQQPAYVVHIFPPCEFSHAQLGRQGFDLMHQVKDLSHLLVIITTVA